MHKRGIFWRWFFPPLLGLTIYANIRLVDYLYVRQRPWRDWSMDLLEIPVAIMCGYLFDYLVRYFVRRNTLRTTGKLTPRIIVQEFFIVFLVCQVLLNAVGIPLVAFTGDGMQWYDLVIHINLIPSLYTLLYYAIARGNAYMTRQFEQQLRLKEAENSHLTSELKFLKAQLHPHFLFDALNTIYFQIDENAVDAKATIEKFAELLRYQLYDHDTKVKISHELEYLQAFIQLQKQRFNTRLKVEARFDPTLNDLEIYPLLLFPLVENAFKYVGGNQKIAISATRKGDSLVFMTENSLSAIVPRGKKDSSGIGLENLSRRLELLYPQRHILDIHQSDRTHKVELTIEL